MSEEFPLERLETPEEILASPFYVHEALDRTSIFQHMVEMELAEHPAIRANPEEWGLLADVASWCLAELYQRIGAYPEWRATPDAQDIRHRMLVHAPVDAETKDLLNEGAREIERLRQEIVVLKQKIPDPRVRVA